MILRRLAFVRHFVCAIILLVFLSCTAEVGLRVRAVWLRTGGNSATVDIGDEAGGLLVPSWQTHHGLKPMSTFTARNPDTGVEFELRTNSYGLRGAEVAVPKPPGVYRIVCLGDEHSLAASVDRSQTYCEQLRLLLQRRTRFEVEVVNAGVPGYCPLLSYLQVKHSLLALQPDILVLNFDMSDVADDPKYRRHTQMSDRGAPLACRHAAFGPSGRTASQRIDEDFLIIKSCKSLLGLISVELTDDHDANDIHAPHGRYGWLSDDPPDWGIYIQQAMSPIAHLGAMGERSFVEVVVATYPAPWQVSRDASDGPGVRERAGIAPDELLTSRRPFEMLAEYLRRVKIPFCDASATFLSAESPERLYHINSPEFSPEGHLLYARELERFLVMTVPGVWSETPPGSITTPVLRQASSERE